MLIGAAFGGGHYYFIANRSPAHTVDAWKHFHDINFVNLNYKPFDASNWPLTVSGLLGPVTLTPATPSVR